MEKAVGRLYGCTLNYRETKTITTSFGVRTIYSFVKRFCRADTSDIRYPDNLVAAENVRRHGPSIGGTITAWAPVDWHSFFFGKRFVNSVPVRAIHRCTPARRFVHVLLLTKNMCT